MAMKQVFEDFKGFIKRGNVLDMAVGVVVGVAFGAITKSLVDDLIMPIVGLATGEVDFGSLFFVLRDGTPPGPYHTLSQASEAGAVVLRYGNFINTIVNFLIVAAAMFFVVRVVQRLNDEGEPESTPARSDPRRCPYCRSELADAATRCPACTSELEAPESAET